MISDFITQLRERESELADSLASTLVEQLKESGVQSVNEWFDSAELAAIDPAEIDVDTFWLVVVRELKAQLLHAIMAYDAWLACNVVRSKSYRPRRLPVMTGDVRDVIIRKYSISLKVLDYVEKAHQEGTRFPLVGAVVEGRLQPDREALRKWRAFFNWNGWEGTSAMLILAG